MEGFLFIAVHHKATLKCVWPLKTWSYEMVFELGLVICVSVNSLPLKCFSFFSLFLDNYISRAWNGFLTIPSQLKIRLLLSRTVSYLHPRLFEKSFAQVLLLQSFAHLLQPQQNRPRHPWRFHSPPQSSVNVDNDRLIYKVEKQRHLIWSTAHFL